MTRFHRISDVFVIALAGWLVGTGGNKHDWFAVSLGVFVITVSILEIILRRRA